MSSVRAMSACRSRYRRLEVGYTVVGFDLDKERVEQLRRGISFIDDITEADLAGVLGSGRYTPSDESGGPRRVHHRHGVRADTAARRRARPHLYRGRGPSARSPRASWGLRGAGIDDVPGYHRGNVRADPGGRIGPACRRRLPRRVHRRSASTRATRPGACRTRRRSSPGSTTPRRPRSPPSTTASSTGRCRRQAPGRPSWRSCSRTPSGTSTSHWSTSWPSPATSSVIDVWSVIDSAATRSRSAS